MQHNSDKVLKAENKNRIMLILTNANLIESNII